MRGTTLANCRTMLKNQLGYNTQANVALATDPELSALLTDMQFWLFSQYQWPFLYTHSDVGLVANTRYYTLPSGISLDYPTEVETKWANLWYPVAYGIKGEQYEMVDPDLNQTLDPACRWQNYSVTQFEIWPVPASVQTLRFWGTGLPVAFVADNDISSLDDELIVLFAAAEKLARAKQRDAPSKLDRAMKLFNRLKGANKPHVQFSMGAASEGDPPMRPGRQRIVGVVGNTNH